jgi:glycosyltransferase involved in cell wall biosynthesis
MSESRLLVDVRLHAHSGIGTYLCHVLPAVIESLPDVRVELIYYPLAPLPMELAELGAAIPWKVAPLSVDELFSRPPVDTAGLWWSPHFNVPLRWRGRLLVTLHDLLPVMRPDLGGGWLRRQVVLAWLRRAIARKASFLSVSEFTRHEFLRLAIARDTRVVVTPLAVDAAWSRAQRHDTSPPHFVYVGVPKVHKNLSTLLRAFGQLSAMIPHDLVLITDWSGLRSYDREAISMAQRMAPRVRIRSALPRSELRSCVASATALVHPAIYEGFGLTPLEAMAAGTPVIACQAGSIPEVCGDAALLVDPLSVDDLAAAMLRVAGDDNLRNELAVKGRARASRYTWAACAAKTSAVLRDVLAEAS